MIFLRKEKETKTLEPTISIDDLYNMGTLEVIVEKENDDESSSSGKDGKYAPYLESSGKTRLVAELRTRGTYVLYISENSSGYPKSTPCAQQFWIQFGTISLGLFCVTQSKKLKEKDGAQRSFGIFN
ncbi:hypothetical protein RhiirC2_707876 [Rhizophagus irregularis]|uniref:Uncharacterized protein n=1 Tax=Rhizophagus irregularis TaxID=588596 RepID=A0A2N1NPF3_9GLOM|nr:hypothetical protein RhiirC2_707876 [Rhizophagus irregularis]